MNYRYSDRMDLLKGTATREIFKLLSRPEIISFAGGLPANESFKGEQMKEVTAEIFSDANSGRIFQYGTTEGFPFFREILANYVKKVGIENTSLDNTLVISGGQQGIDLMCKAFINKDDVVLVEDPTYLAFLQILNSYEGKAIGVKTTRDGLDLDDLEDKIIRYNPKMLYVVPTFSNPTGKTYSVNNRKEIARLAEKYNIMVLEDDPYSKLRFEGESVPALKSFDQSGNVVYISSFSKILSPGMRVGVAIGDKEVIRKMAICKQGTDLHTSNLSQAIAAKYIEKGYIDKNIAEVMPIYTSRRNAMLTAMDKYMPEELSHTIPLGGLFIWCEIAADINTVSILPEAVEKNVAYIQGSVFFADGGGLNTLRLNFSNATEEKIEIGVKALGELLKRKIVESGYNGKKHV